MVKSFAELLREYRGDRSQARVSEILDISPTYYSELERGKKEPSYRILSQIVARSGKEMAFWLGGEEALSPGGQRLSSEGTAGEKIPCLTVPEITVMLGKLWYSIDNSPIHADDRKVIAEMLDACRRSLDKTGK